MDRGGAAKLGSNPKHETRDILGTATGETLDYYTEYSQVTNISILSFSFKKGIVFIGNTHMQKRKFGVIFIV